MSLELIEKTDKVKESLVSLSVRDVYGSFDINLSHEEVIVLCLVKNGEQYVRDFIKYYLDLGVKHIVFLDNGSGDQTLELIKKYGGNNVIILQTNFYFGNNNDMRMRDYLINRFAKNRWSLCVDIDEFFDYPCSEVLPLNDLIKYLNENKYTAVVSQMLDMVPKEIHRKKERVFKRKDHQYCEFVNIKKKDYFLNNNPKNKFDCDIKIYSEGIRKTIFDVSPMLTKHALIFNEVNTKRNRFGHLLDNGRIADFSSVLFHYKFTNNFFDYVEDAVKKKYHYDNSREYASYLRVVKDSSKLNLVNENSFVLKATSELIDNGFLVVSKNYLDLINSNKKIEHLFSLDVDRIRNKDLDNLDLGVKEDVTCLVVWRNVGVERLKNCLRSLRNQDYDQKLLKIVLVDYGSDEVVSENLKDFLKNNGVSCIKVRNVKNWNRSHALNIGLKNCSTKYILCSDIDMVFEKNYISECVKEMQFNMFHVLYTDMLDSPKNFGRLDFINDYGKIRKKCKGRGAAFVNSAYKYGSSICFTLSYFFKVIRGYDEFYKLWGAEDEDVQKRLELMGLVFKDVSSKTSHIHQWHPQHEGVKNTKGFEDQVKKNEIYLRENNSIIRNPNGWGLYD